PRREELDLADAARPELDLIGEFPLRHLFADLRVQLAHRRERTVIEIFAVHERAHDRGERAVFTAGPERARLDPGVAFPFPALRHEIFLQRVEARGERPGVSPGAKAPVAAENGAVSGARVVPAGERAAPWRAAL